MINILYLINTNQPSNMKLYSVSCFLLFFGIFVANAQYTETINSNRPGNSQGAYAVGPGVLQLETSLEYGEDQHILLNTETELWGIGYAVRYGFFMEQLEINLQGSFLDRTTSYRVGSQIQTDHIRNFDANAIGLKYLVYDPYKIPREREPNLYSWRANQRFDWSLLIPAVAVYAGANLALADNPYLYEEEARFSPRLAIITQNNWGPWVLVLNLIADKIADVYPSYSGIATVTHSFSKRFAAFAELQVRISDLYSDELLRGGFAYLIYKDLQADISGLVNLKNTPSRWQAAVGFSYRFDWHKQDQYIKLEEDQQ